MDRLPTRLLFVLVVCLLAVLAAVFGFVSLDPRSMPAVDQLAGTCSGLYRDNPEVAALLVATMIGIPAGYLAALLWPRAGLTSYGARFDDRRTSR